VTVIGLGTGLGAVCDEAVRLTARTSNNTNEDSFMRQIPFNAAGDTVCRSAD